MFARVETLPEGRGARLRALRLSLNTPVVSIDALPIAPARAGIALHDGGADGACLTIALRCERTRQLVCFTPNDDLDTLGGAEMALEAALSFAESLGFLFDDDLLAPEADPEPREAALRWGELVGEDPEAPEPEGEIEAELLLNEVVEATAMSEGHDVESESEGDDDWQLERSTLTKFRRAVAGGTAPP